MNLATEKPQSPRMPLNCTRRINHVTSFVSCGHISEQKITIPNYGILDKIHLISERKFDFQLKMMVNISQHLFTAPKALLLMQGHAKQETHLKLDIGFGPTTYEIFSLDINYLMTQIIAKIDLDILPALFNPEPFPHTHIFTTTYDVIDGGRFMPIPPEKNGLC